MSIGKKWMLDGLVSTHCDKEKSLIRSTPDVRHDDDQTIRRAFVAFVDLPQRRPLRQFELPVVTILKKSWHKTVAELTDHTCLTISLEKSQFKAK
jgi:hypothetical protein